MRIWDLRTGDEIRGSGGAGTPVWSEVTHVKRGRFIDFDAKIADSVLSIDLALVVAKVKLLIRRGRIMEVAVAGCEASATLKYGPHVLLQREAKELEFPVTLKLGEGIEIPAPLDLIKARDGAAD